LSYTDASGKTWRVVAWTPFGREETVSILKEYMARDHAAGVVDRWDLYMNTDADQVTDRNYGYGLAEAHGWIRAVERPAGEKVLHPKQLNTGRYYRYAVEENTVYVRFDDDIVYVHPDAITRMAQAKVSSPSLVVFPIVWHNAVCSYYLQQLGKIPKEFGVVKAAYCMDPVGWSDGEFARKIHELLLGHIEAGTVEELFLHHDIQLPMALQFSVSCFAALSDAYRAMKPIGHLDYYEEEAWHTIHRPPKIGHPNMITGNALVAHLSFLHHTNYIRRETDILTRYRALAEKLAAQQ
jgi:hypothetical protein